MVIARYSSRAPGRVTSWCRHDWMFATGSAAQPSSVLDRCGELGFGAISPRITIGDVRVRSAQGLEFRSERGLMLQ